jgi:integrase
MNNNNHEGNKNKKCLKARYVRKDTPVSDKRGKEVKREYLIIQSKPKQRMQNQQLSNKRPWSSKEVSQFLAVANKEGKGLLYDFTLSTGLRLGEVLALPWFNVDLKQGTVTVSRSVSFFSNEGADLSTSRSHHRTISLPPSLVEKMKKHKEEQNEIKQRLREEYRHGLDLVFPRMDGGLRNPSSIRFQLYRLIEKANLWQINFHELRNIHESRLVQNGAHPQSIQERLGR